MTKEELENMRFQIEKNEPVISQEQYNFLIALFTAMIGQRPSIKLFANFLKDISKEIERNHKLNVRKNRSEQNEAI